MEETAYGLKVKVPLAFDAAVRRITEALQAQGFGVLTTIDVQETLRVKLNRDFRRYVILGACNPPLADRALHAEIDIGLLLPCNVTVRQLEDGAIEVSMVDPLMMMSVISNPALSPIAAEARARLERVAQSLEK